MSYEHTVEEKLSFEDHAKSRKQSFGKTGGLLSPNDSRDSNKTSESSGDAKSLENEDWYFSTKRLKPEYRLTPAQRRLLLREAGIIKIDRSEEEDCKEIRDSRRKSGCNCRQSCVPDKCSCCKSGIQCYVEDEDFPCKCNKRDCLNPYGHLEYSPDSVYNHYARTMERLKREGY